ncbi:MAG: hypothetical protein Q4Q27_12005 [Methanosarcina mazei]|nr:hypothetical protein [Methanosarcina mazei]
MNIRCIRDFIYVDIERVKSIISQFEEGVVNETQILSGNSGGSSLCGEGGLAGILKGGVNSEFKFHRQLSETKSLHDYIYNKVESLLLNENQLLRIPNEETYTYSPNLRTSLGNTSFILAKGKVTINDFSRLSKLLDNYEELSKYIAKCAISSKKQNLTQAQAKLAYDDLLHDLTKNFDKEMRRGMTHFINMFYQDRVVIKIIPYEEYPDFRLVGNIDKTYLRDDIESIIYKYGTAPVSDWTIFGQIASVPPENRSDQMFNVTGNQIENAFQQMFDAYRKIENMAQSVTYPEIAITPIAIYRE